MEGYVKVAALMSRYPELAIVRRFGDLNMQNLLYLQAELTHLELEYKELVSENRQFPEKADYAKDWLALSQSPDGDNTDEWELFLKIRAKLKEYSKSILPLPVEI
jgi:hypothetical protein